MKSSKLFALFVAMLLATASFSQGLITVRPKSGDTLSVRINDIEMAFVKSGKTNLLLTNRKNTIEVIDSLGYIAANSCNSFLDVDENGARLLLSKNHLKSVTKSGTKGKVTFLGGSTVVTDDLWASVLAQAVTPVGCGGSGGATDLTYTAAATNGVVNSSTGTDATIPQAVASNINTVGGSAGLVSNTDKFRIDNAILLIQGGNGVSVNYSTGSNPITRTAQVSFALSSYNVAISGGNSGAALRVTATGTGITASYASNVYTIAIPAGVTILSANLIVVTADIQASADAGGFTDWVAVNFNDVDGNTGVTTLRTPQVQRVSIPTSGALAANNGASIDNDNNPASTVIGATTNDITIRFSGMSVGAQGYELGFNF